MSRVVWIVGQAYCGSTLLNLLLDTQPRVRGIGEGWQVYRNGKTDAPCSECRRPVNDCDFYRDYQGGPFYWYSALRYRAEVIVDASKSAEWLLDKPFEDRFEHRVIVLSKAPHEAAWSLIQHARYDEWDPDYAGNLARFREPYEKSVDACFGKFFAEYREHLQRLHESPLIRNTNIRSLTYRELATRPKAVVCDLCNWLDVPFSPAGFDSVLWKTTTHVIGGNPAILSHLADQDVTPTGIARYLGGKHAGQPRAIRYDATWRSDPAFVAECRAAYDRWAEPLAWLLPQLGHDRQTI